MKIYFNAPKKLTFRRGDIYRNTSKLDRLYLCYQYTDTGGLALVDLVTGQSLGSIKLGGVGDIMCHLENVTGRYCIKEEER